MALALKQLSESIFTEQMLTKWVTVLKFMFATQMLLGTLYAGKICVHVECNSTSQPPAGYGSFDCQVSYRYP